MKINLCKNNKSNLKKKIQNMSQSKLSGKILFLSVIYSEFNMKCLCSGKIIDPFINYDSSRRSLNYSLTQTDAPEGILFFQRNPQKKKKI